MEEETTTVNRSLLDDETSLLLKPASPQVYKRRWYILTLFVLCGFTEGILYNTWGPINQSAKLVYSWSNTELALLVNWGNITYGAFVFFASYAMDVKGLRLSMLFTICLLSVGSGLRLITMEPGPSTWLINVGQILIGFGGCVPFSGASLLSSTWFPPYQRTTATAIGSMAAYVGDSLGFIIGPLIVKQLSWTKLTDSHNLTHTDSQADEIFTGLITNNTDPYEKNRQKSELFRLYLIEFCCSVGLGLLILLYFPSKPPSAASKSSTEKRLHYKDGFLTLTRSIPFWIINAAFSPNGVALGWISVLGVILTPVGINQEQAGWIGFSMGMSGCVAALMVSRFADLVSGRMKETILVMYFITIGCLIWLILIEASVITFSLVQVYVSCALIGMCINGSFPLFMEMACEGAYPVAEGITCGYLTMVHNTSSMVFLVILMIPNIGTLWANYTFLGCVILAIPFLCVYKEERNRSHRDEALCGDN